MHRIIAPYHQGDLDGLCGIYAVINSVRLLCPECDDEIADRLFRKLVNETAKRKKRPMRVVWGGMERPLLWALAKRAKRDLSKMLSIEITVAALELPDKPPDIPEIWSALQEVLEGSTVAILGLAGRRYHWTVTYRISAKQMWLQDSGKLKVLLRSRCSTRSMECRYVLSPEHIILLRRSVQE